MRAQSTTNRGDELVRLSMLLAIGWVVTNLALSIMDLPLKFLLKDSLRLTPAMIAGFFALGNFCNYIKPIAGVLTDSIPFLGTRRRHYLLLATAGGGIGFVALGLVPREYAWLLATYFVFYMTVVLFSTTLGGRMVEVGQQYRAAGRLTAQRIATFRIAALLGGPIGGFLALYPFGLTVAISAALHLGLFALFYARMPERPTARINTRAIEAAKHQFGALFQCRPLLISAGMVFLLAAAPGFGTPLLFYQTDVLHFSKPFIGGLGSISAFFGILATALYYAFCRRYSLRMLLAMSILVHTAGTMYYLAYHSHTSAMLITALNGITVTLATLPIYDLAARATPRGSEAMGYSVMMSMWNLTNALSDWFGSWLYTRFHLTFIHLVWINAGTTLAVILALPILPAMLLSSRDGDPTPSATTAVVAEPAVETV